MGLAAVSAVLVLLDLAEFRREQRRTRFRPRDGDDFGDVRETLANTPRFRFVQLRMGSFVWDLTASRALEDDTLNASKGPINYVLPQEIRRPGRLFQRKMVARSVNAYNAPVLGLNTDLGSGDDLPTGVVTQPSRYWDYLASDVLATQDTVIDGRDRPEIGRSLVVDRNGALRDYGDSWLLNAVGVSLLAVTADGRFVVTTQSDRNDSSQGLFAPSGSGSLEPQDYRGASRMSFRRLCANGALRELREETSILEEDVEQWSPLGMGRWLDKSAKPEVLLVCLLRIDSHEVARRSIPRQDRSFTLAVEAERFTQAPGSWDESDVRTMAPDRVVRAMSVPLELSMTMLAHRAASATADPFFLELCSRVEGT